MTRALLNTADRSFAGFTATLINLDTGDLEVTTRAGYQYETDSYKHGVRTNAVTHRLGNRELLRQLCDELRKRPGQWRIRSISTPDSILCDLKGRKPHLKNHRYPEHPELQMLGSVDAMDLLDNHQASEGAAA